MISPTANVVNNEILIGEMVKNAKITVKVRITEFKGNKYVDIRDYFLPKGAAVHGPTKKGITIPAARVSEIINLMEAAEAKVKVAP